MNGDMGVWAYAITEHGHLSEPDAAVDLSWLAGVGEAKVRTVGCDELAVLVSDVSMAEFGEAALRANLENLDWLDEVARQHHYVIDAAARMFPLLPARLATVYSGDAAVCAALAGRSEQLLDALRRVGGRVEWGVKAYTAPVSGGAGPVPVASESEGTRAGGNAGSRTGQPGSERTGRADGGTGGAGLAYLRRRRTQLAAGRETRLAAVNGARAVHAELSGKAAAARLHPPQSPQLSGVRQPMLLNAAYLLDAADGMSFTAAVADQATLHPELRIELTGPWPPYSFADDDDDGR
jgi:Gas vesicle synthesis protein GvpL/GvpF